MGGRVTDLALTRRGEATRSRLLEAAASELVERDGQLEVASVAARADVSVGLLYRYFGSKAGLVRAVVEDFYDRLFAETSRARELAASYPDVDVVDDIRAVVADADVVCLTTDADEPVVDFGDLRPGCHVSSVGSGHEVDTQTVDAARVFVESRAAATQPFPAGSRELAGRDPATITEVGEVLLGTTPGRQSPDELTLYKSMGHAAEDVAAAAIVWRAAQSANARGIQHQSRSDR